MSIKEDNQNLNEELDTNMIKVTALSAIQEAYGEVSRLTLGREMAMVKTKLDEARLWLGEIK